MTTNFQGDSFAIFIAFYPFFADYKFCYRPFTHANDGPFHIRPRVPWSHASAHAMFSGERLPLIIRHPASLNGIAKSETRSLVMPLFLYSI
ncbi:hypothetical protein BN2476_650036 [Paraburkholderia piptadeniae]|uniref:Uncharacterized protein n=1 Tax=Paraburkholderia piptadeniae TaxID=1701573 RepID=A0A1N7SN31_9BURK|nr:hypothetical protein BN2476_650036 [Paraburkholderia piptadeniae]